MISTFFFVTGTLLISLNLFRILGISISDWFYLAALICAIIETITIERDKFKCWFQNKYLWYAFLILLGAVISLANAKFLQNAIIEIAQLIFVITVFISLIWIMVLRNKIRVVIKAFVFSGFFTSLVALYDFITGSRLGPTISNTPYVQLWGRYAGTLGHPNKLGFLLVITTILTFYLVFSSYKWKKLLWISCLLIQLLGIYLSGSLTAYLGLLLGVFLLFLYKIQKNKFPLRIISSIIFLCAAFLVAILALSNMNHQKPVNLQSITLMITIDRVISQTSESRIVIFKDAFQSILKSPLVGVGFDQISTSGINRTNREIAGTVHNAEIQMFYVGGIFSFMGFLLIYANLTVHSITVIHRMNWSDQPILLICLAVATLSIILMDQFQDSLYQREKWLIIGLFVANIWLKKYLGERKQQKINILSGSSTDQAIKLTPGKNIN